MDPAVKVEFPQMLRRKMAKALSQARRREIGGILMAEQIEAGHFLLVDFTVDEVTGSAAHFVRSVDHHRSALSTFFERTASDFARFNYLGEWHSHPNHLPIPSSTDIASMRSLVSGERDIPFAMLLIVRVAWWRRLLMSATLFQNGASPEPVEIVAEAEGRQSRISRQLQESSGS
jgi:[CysO sulfur-carrier protein]-S-L-cysteine hydrolase